MARISYPVMGNYSVAAYYLLSNVLDDEVIKPPDITKKTVEIGTRYSPEFVCSPFKYTLGTLMESLELGADTLLQMGGGCRYGYYHELQEKVLKDMGFSFKLINLVSGGRSIPLKSLLNDYGLHVKKISFPRYFFITKKMISYIDCIEDYIRKHRCCEKNKGAFDSLERKMLDDFANSKGYFSLRKLYKKYDQEFKNIELDETIRPLKVGLVGELYTLMEPGSNHNIEAMLSEKGVSITRYINVTYLLFKKKRSIKRYLKNFFIKYPMGADALDNIYHTKYFCENGYDGIIHIKSSFCTPEISAMPIIESLGQQYDVPIIFFSMDMNTSKTGVQTRIDAFCDMLEMRREH